MHVNEKNNFVRISKKLVTDLKIILLESKSNYVERLSVYDNTAKSFNILATSLNILYNYFDGSNKIIFRYLAKFLYFNNSFFSCV